MLIKYKELADLYAKLLKEHIELVDSVYDHNCNHKPKRVSNMKDKLRVVK